MNRDLKNPEQLTYFIVNAVTTVMSILGSLWTCYFCLKLKSSQNYSMKFILAITIADFIYSLSNLMSIFEDSDWVTLCQLESIVRECSLQFTLFFSTCFALLCYKCTKFGSRYDQALFFKKCIAVGIFMWLWLNGLFWFTDEVIATSKGTSCHLIANPDNNSKIMQQVISAAYFGLPIIIELIIIVVAYVKMDREIKASVSESTGQMEGISLRKLFWYPAIQFITFGPRFLDTLARAYGGEESTFYFVIKLIHLLSTHSIGFINAVLYGIQMKSYYKKINDDGSRNRFLSFLGDTSTIYEDEDISLHSS